MRISTNHPSFPHLAVALTFLGAAGFASAQNSAPARTETTRLPNGNLQIALHAGPADSNVAIERSVDLKSWTFLQSVTSSNLGSAFHLDAAPPTPRAFYRHTSAVPVWNSSTVDGTESNSTSTSMAFGPDGLPAIAYQQNSGGTGALKFARFDGSTWNTGTVVSSGYSAFIGRYTSLAFAPDGQPAIAYFDNLNDEIRLARFDGSSWSTSIVDSTDSSVWNGQHISMAFGPDGQPAVAYFYAISQDLKIARFDGSTWSRSVVDSAGVVGEYCSLAFGPDGQPAISYHDRTNFDLKFARFDGSGWSTGIVDGIGTIGWYNSLAFGPDGQPAISFYDASVSALKFTRFDGSSWNTNILDSAGDVGRFSSLAFGPDGQPGISYLFFEPSLHLSTLKFARFDGSNWKINPLDLLDGPLGFPSTSLSFAPDGHPSVSYTYDGFDVKYARTAVVPTAP